MARYLEPYDKRAYVPGGSSKKKAQAIQTQGLGRITPVSKPRVNPYIRPLPGGGSGPVSPSSPASPAAISKKEAPKLNFDFNYESDPVLARIKALGQQNVANAQTEATALRNQAILDTGLTDVGREIGLDENILQAAENNPLSLKAQLAREAQLTGRNLDESLNRENLFWSGTRANRLSELATNQAAAQAELARDLRSALGGIDSGLLEAQTAEALREQEAMEAAAAQAREEAMQQAYLDALAGMFSTEATNLYPEVPGGNLGINAPVPGVLYDPSPIVPSNEFGIPESIVQNTGGQFLTPETAAAAQVSPFNYDPINDIRSRPLENRIPGAITDVGEYGYGANPVMSLIQTLGIAPEVAPPALPSVQPPIYPQVQLPILSPEDDFALQVALLGQRQHL